MITVETVERQPGAYSDEPVVLFLKLGRSWFFGGTVWHFSGAGFRALGEQGTCGTAVLPFAVRGYLDALLNPI